MKRWKTAAILVFGLIFCGIKMAGANTSGAATGNTNAPGEQNCAVCHNSFGLNSGSGSLNILGIPRDYISNQTYGIELVAQDPDKSIWGFEITVVNDKGDSVGSFALTDTVSTQQRSGSVGGKARDYVLNTIAGSFAGIQPSVSWKFNWTAPSQVSGTVTFYAAAVSGDRDGSPRGDRVYSTTITTRVSQPGPPSINFISPTSGPESGGTRVTLRGANFQSGLKIAFDGLDAQGQFIDDTTATAVSPQHQPGSSDIRLTNPDGVSVNLPQAFLYNPAPKPPPRVAFVSPSRGPTAGGSVIKVVGENFQQGANIIIDGKQLETAFIDQNSLSATAPIHNPGPVKVGVLNPDGMLGELEDAFTYEGSVPPPIIKLLSPIGGEVFSAGGAAIAIRWTIESNGTPVQRLLLSTDGGATFPVVIANQLGPTTNQFNLILPEDLESNRARLRLEAIQSEGTSVDETKKDFSIVKAPKISRILPATTKAGTSKLTADITGMNFDKGAKVEMNGVLVKAKVVSPTAIKIKKLPHATPGISFIRILNPDGGTSGSFLFTVAQ